MATGCLTQAERASIPAGISDIEVQRAMEFNYRIPPHANHYGLSSQVIGRDQRQLVHGPVQTPPGHFSHVPSAFYIGPHVGGSFMQSIADKQSALQMILQPQQRANDIALSSAPLLVDSPSASAISLPVEHAANHGARCPVKAGERYPRMCKRRHAEEIDRPKTTSVACAML
eukprot:CAMPEP_0183336650 /NCGR_PEP_ID=MMETSP0164_2-20130417/4570_1 /TAXON_ID=221442 /ORGANISM="Coccolithus pelagicus ssp braarudi, Strain PLY182g" /LENGTH=171 /DNA_ID=CAMNT_0025506219 /DNA_START=8 /DNA_END=524 /DNA_ORIENTATION=+